MPQLCHHHPVPVPLTRFQLLSTLNPAPDQSCLPRKRIIRPTGSDAWEPSQPGRCLNRKVISPVLGMNFSFSDFHPNP
ncbi:unnamed protein product [Caretta caretta]